MRKAAESRTEGDRQESGTSSPHAASYRPGSTLALKADFRSRERTTANKNGDSAPARVGGRPNTGLVTGMLSPELCI